MHGFPTFIVGFIIFLLIVIVVVLAVGESEPEITEGRVIHKEYHEEYNTVIMMPIVVSTGKTSTTSMIPIWQHHPATWEIVIEAFDEESNRVEENFYVNESVYNEVSIGDFFRFDEDMGSRNKPVVEREATEEEQKQLKGD